MAETQEGFGYVTNETVPPGMAAFIIHFFQVINICKEDANTFPGIHFQADAVKGIAV